MILKRKRSEAELSFSSAFSSPPRPGSSKFNFGEMATSPRPSAPSHLPNRTMKRFRDNRPSDAEVHQHTLQLLYSAQQQQNSAQTQLRPQPETPSSTVRPERHSPSDHQQRSLHSFWNISVSASNAGTPLLASCSPLAPRNISAGCEDCGAALGNSHANGDGITMEVDGCEEHSCGACGKIICFSCSISNLGENRRCLACAQRRVWLGGTGWTTRVHVC
ncbi:hypothetical protein B0T24DRAFT_640738 [Lasiosphaeria ovina]|uniref:Uncharacterized protein n=1 Tax=Lasiosphaeria ovina TaxID=92902 RepID=A0AAE0JUI3_9PEZI|nr:hypothetical protein B0T24DRAFT_640738 [Lasiosphaeria ovina]